MMKAAFVSFAFGCLMVREPLWGGEILIVTSVVSNVASFITTATAFETVTTNDVTIDEQNSKLKPSTTTADATSITNVSSEALRDKDENTIDSANDNNKCRLYLARSTYAPSSLVPTSSFEKSAAQDNDPTKKKDENDATHSTVLGLYTSEPLLTIGAPIGSPEIGIPLIDLGFHNPNDIHVDLFWSAGELLAFEDDHGAHSLSIIPGLGFAGSHNTAGWSNFVWDYKSPLDRYRISKSGAGKELEGKGDIDRNGTGALDWRIHPGAGASSEYFHIVARTLSSIHAGSELFPYVHNAGSTTAIETTQDDNASNRKDLNKARSIMKQFDELVRKHPDYFVPEEQEALWQMLLTEVLASDSVKELLPPRAEDARFLAVHNDDVDEGGNQASNSSPKRSVEWLERHGRCADNLLAKASTINGAGRGAFATRPLSNGTIVALGPLIRFQKHELNMYRMDKNTKERRVNDVYGRQLLVNYCFGYEDSNLYFFPFGPMVNYINHDGARPNVRIQWSTSPENESFLLDLPLKDYVQRYGPFGLMVDYVALRDIEEGEEILMDYGSSWEGAWAAHMNKWHPPQQESAFPTASTLNELDLPFPTPEEQEAFKQERGEEKLYSPHVKLLCTAYHVDEIIAEEKVGGSGGKFQMNVSNFENSHKVFDWYDLDKNFESECTVIDRQYKPANSHQDKTDSGSGEAVYLVQVPPKKVDVKGSYIRNVPHRSMIYYDVKYTSAMHMQTAFRHVIGMPNEIYPKQWLAGG